MTTARLSPGRSLDETDADIRRDAGLTRLRATALAVLTLSTIFVALLPVSGRQVTYQWTPPTSFNAGKVQLMMPASPERLTASWPCSAIRGFAPPPGQFPSRFFSTGFSSDGQVTAWVDASTVSLQLAGRPVIGAQLPLPSGECTLQIRYDDRSRTFTLADGAQTRTVPVKTSVVRDTDAVDAPQVTGLQVPVSLASATEVTVVARPSTQAWTITQWAAALAGLLAAAILWWSYLRASVPLPARRSTPRWALSDTIVSVSAVAALFLIPPLADDGWVLTTIRAFPQLGFFSNYFTADAAAQPEGFWWTSIERIWVSPLGTAILMLRVPSLVIAVLTWWYLRRRVLDQVGDDRRWSRTIGALVFVPLLFAWSPTLRPEPLVALLAVIAVALVVRLRERHDGWVLVTLAIVSALAFSAHQTGWVVIGAAFAALPDVRRWVRAQRRAALPAVVVAGGTFVLLVLLLMMLKSNAAILLQARESFIEGGKHNALLDEAMRIRGLLSSASTSPVRLLSALLVPVAALAWLLLTWKGWPSTPARLAAGASALGGMFLAFTSSKWQWHFAATVGLVTIAAVLLAQRALQTRRGTAGLVVAVATCGWLVATRRPGWGLQDLRAYDGSSPMLPALAGLLVYALITGVALWLLHMGRARRDVSIAMVAVVSTFTALGSVGPVLVDAAMAPTTAWPRLVASSVRPGDCGIASSLTVPTSTRALVKSPAQMADPAITEILWATKQTLPKPPVPATPIIVPSGGLPVPLATPWYLLDEAAPARLWIHAAEPGALAYSVEWRTADGGAGSTTHSRPVTAPAWYLVELSPPDDAVDARVTWMNSPTVDAVSSPVAVTAQAPLTAIARGPVLRTPDSALYAPCFPQPDISRGAMQSFDWSLGLPLLGQSKSAVGVADFSEQACIDNPTNELYPPMCWYRVDNPQPAGLTTSTGYVSR